jgi:hypothetical protein
MVPRSRSHSVLQFGKVPNNSQPHAPSWFGDRLGKKRIACHTSNLVLLTTTLHLLSFTSVHSERNRTKIKSSSQILAILLRPARSRDSNDPQGTRLGPPPVLPRTCPSHPSTSSRMAKETIFLSRYISGGLPSPRPCHFLRGCKQRKLFPTPRTLVSWV